MPKWQLNPANIPSEEDSNIWVEDTLADLFPADERFTHTPPDVHHHHRYRLKSLKSVARSLTESPDTLLRPNVVHATTGKQLYNLDDASP